MKALIKSLASEWGDINNRKPESLHNYLIKNRGKWVEIDTSYLFDNQYNTLDGYRIFDRHIEKIAGDERMNFGKCKYCGELTAHALPCLKTEHCVQYGVDNLANSFFCKNPQGIDKVKDVNIPWDEKTGYSVYTVNGLYYRISRRHNLEFVLVNGVPYIWSIGYIHYKECFTLSNNEKKILERVAKVIQGI